MEDNAMVVLKDSCLLEADEDWKEIFKQPFK